MEELIVLAATASAVVVCVLIHYQAFIRLTGVMGRRRVRRRGLIVVLLGLITAHLTEIGVFALLYQVLNIDGRFGGIAMHLTGGAGLAASEYFYFSAVVYTTLGFGDLVPYGALRLVTAIEALTGFSLITWSASFTFLEMQQFWVSEDR
jgi:hypothetical protein